MRMFAIIKMTGLNVKGKNYFSTLKGKFNFEEISDLGEVEVAESEEESDVLEMNRVLTANNVRVAAVTQLTTYNECIQCCAKTVCSDDAEIGTCTRCKTMQLISESKEELSAHACAHTIEHWGYCIHQGHLFASRFDARKQ